MSGVDRTFKYSSVSFIQKSVYFDFPVAFRLTTKTLKYTVTALLCAYTYDISKKEIIHLVLSIQKTEIFKIRRPILINKPVPPYSK